MMMAYLASSMSHINEGIRLDGLKFLDGFLKAYPELIPFYSSKVRHCFVYLYISVDTF